MFCANCGREVAELASFCASCGAKVGGTMSKNEATKPEAKLVRKIGNGKTFGYPIGYVPKNKLKTFLLCLLFGIFGMHHFYAGKKLDGIFKIVLFFFFIGALGTNSSDWSDFPSFLILGTLLNAHILLVLVVLGCLILWVLDIAKIYNGTFTDKEGFPLCYPQEAKYPEGLYAKKQDNSVIVVYFSWLACRSPFPSPWS